MANSWLHTMDTHGLTPLDRAFASGHMSIAELMLRQEKEDQSEALKGSTPLHRAAYLGLTEAVQSLLTYGADPLAVDRQGETALHKAVRKGHLSIVKLLIGRSEVDAASHIGMTALHWAAATGNLEMVKILLVHGADPTRQDEYIDNLCSVSLAGKMGYKELETYFHAREIYV